MQEAALVLKWHTDFSQTCEKIHYCPFAAIQLSQPSKTAGGPLSVAVPLLSQQLASVTVTMSTDKDFSSDIVNVLATIKRNLSG